MTVCYKTEKWGFSSLEPEDEFLATMSSKSQTSMKMDCIKH